MWVELAGAIDTGMCPHVPHVHPAPVGTSAKHQQGSTQGTPLGLSFEQAQPTRLC